MPDKKDTKSKKPNVVIIGGGTGSFVILSGLRKYPVNLTALITMMDSGGSSGRLRDQLGVLPPGDLRQALVALAQDRRTWLSLFTYRFESGELKGHNFGNIFLSALEKMTGSIENGVELASEVLNTQGHVIPITLDNTTLCVRLKNGDVIKGEKFIDEDERERPQILESFLSPNAKANPQALKAIKNADYIIVGPGDLYTSLIPNFVVEGVAKAFAKSKAKKIFVMNLMTKVGQTDGFTASDHVNEITKYAGFSDFDYVVVNKKNPTKKTVAWYEHFHVGAVKDDLKDGKKLGVKVIRGDIISEVTYKAQKADVVKRSLLRHDSEKLAALVVKSVLCI